MTTVYIDCDVTYELEVDFQPGRPESRSGNPDHWSPGEPGEVSLPCVVTRWQHPSCSDIVTLATFVREFAAWNGLTEHDAWHALHTHLVNECEDRS